MNPTAISRRAAFSFWLKLGFISFGGPAGQIAIMHRELVEGRRWISEARFLHALNYCMVLPGPEAQQLATYIGWLMHGTVGGIVAGALFVLPSLFILIALSWAYLVWGQVPLIAGMFLGIKPAVTAIVLHAAWRIGSRTLKTPALFLIAALAFVCVTALALPFPLIVAGAALCGVIGHRLAPRQFPGAGGHGNKVVAADDVALIGDHTPTPPHARFRATRFGSTLACGLTLWAGGMYFLQALVPGTLAAMGWFFTKAAMLTFGGAYAVLPYVYQGAVVDFQWLSAQQMLDGLALGETTPGPLIMVVAFVGFLGGWQHAVLGPDALFAGAALAATVVTFFTFLPSFLFILLGSPLVEATHGQLKITAPLTAITAAVVGVIVNLGVFFAWHVWWPQANANAPFAGVFDAFSMLVTLVAAVALFSNKVGVLRVIGVCALVGVLRTFW